MNDDDPHEEIDRLEAQIDELAAKSNSYSPAASL
jgi:hypothetical protein